MYIFLDFFIKFISLYIRYVHNKYIYTIHSPDSHLIKLIHYPSSCYTGAELRKKKFLRSQTKAHDRKAALLQALAEVLPLGTIRFSSKPVSMDTEPAAGADFSEAVVVGVRLDDGTDI
jgi:hypothetical protein